MICAYVAGGGKQHKVQVGDHIRVEKLDVSPGDTVNLDQVLAVVDAEGKAHFGTPYLEGSSVTATVTLQGKGEKIRMLKMRRRKNSRTRQGHRQLFTELKILSIEMPGAKKAPAEKKAAEADAGKAESAQADAKPDASKAAAETTEAAEKPADNSTDNQED